MLIAVRSTQDFARCSRAPAWVRLFLHSRDYRHAGIEKDEEHDETAHEGPEYDM